MKIAVVRGGNLCKSDSVVFSHIAKKYDLTYIGIKNARMDLSGINGKKILLYSPETFLRWIGYPLIVADYFLNFNLTLFGLKSKLKDFDIVETADTTYPFSYQTVKNHPIVISNCFENIPFFREGGITKIYKNQVRLKAKHFIAATEKAKSALMLEGVEEERISVISPGVDLDLLRPKPKDKKLLKKYNLTDKNINIIFAGRMVYDKGIEDLLYAFKLLSDKHNHARLLLDSRGKCMNIIQQRILELNLTNKIRFLDSVPYDQREKSYNLSDIVCNPSRITKYWQEQFGFVLVEAMACGKPVVGTYTGSIPEVLGGAGVLVSTANHLELFEKLDELVSNEKLRKEIGKKARERAIKHYDAKIVANKRIRLYEQIYKKYSKKTN